MRHHLAQLAARRTARRVEHAVTIARAARDDARDALATVTAPQEVAR